jgi:hypothetical protein
LGAEIVVATIQLVTTTITAIAIAIFGLSWGVASLLRGSPVPYRNFKEYGNGLMTDVIHSSFLLVAYAAISALVTWFAQVLVAAS